MQKRWQICAIIAGIVITFIIFDAEGHLLDDIRNLVGIILFVLIAPVNSEKDE